MAETKSKNNVKIYRKEISATEKTIEKEKYEEIFPEALSSSHANGVIKTKT